MSDDFTDEFEEALHQVGLPSSRNLIGGQILCDCFSGFLRTTILSVSNLNDDGYVELGVAPVNFRGDLVTHVVFIGIDEHRVRTKHLSHNDWVNQLHRCKAHIM
jgi:hypothetical protein